MSRKKGKLAKRRGCFLEGLVRIIETYYLIDYENVHTDGLTGCKTLGKSDHIIIFYTDHAKNLDMTSISEHGGATLEMERVPTGNQFADMHILSYLGFLAGKYGKQCKVTIVSKDKDYDNVIKYWQSKTGINASRTQQIKEEKAKQVRSSKKQSGSASSSEGSAEEKTRLNREIMQELSKNGYESKVVNKVAHIVSNHYGDEKLKQNVHNELRKNYSDYRELYEIIKPILSWFL